MSDRFAPNVKLAAQRSFVDFLEGKKIVPINVEISPCGTCNAKCPWCFYAGKHKPVFIKDKEMFELIRDMALMGVKAITYTGGGEPTLHPMFSEFVHYAYNLDIKQGLITNAILPAKFEPRLFDWIRVSLTPTPFKVANLKLLRACKTFGICINDTGSDEVILQTLKIAEEVKADYVQVRPALKLGGKTTHIRTPEIDHPLLEKTPYKYEDANQPHAYKRCFGFNFVPFIWEDGDVCVCAYQRGVKGYVLGNIYKKSFVSIMKFAPRHVMVRPDCQVCCKNHETNKLVNAAMELKEGDFV